MYRRVSILLAVALLAGLLVSWSPGGEREAKATLGPLQAVTLTGADFHSYSDEADFVNVGNYVISNEPQLARIPFPAETVVITSVKIRAYDDYGSGDLCVYLYRALPGDADEDALGDACTSGTSVADPQTLSIPVFKRVGRFHTAYLWASFASAKSSFLRLYGATVFYRAVT